MISRLTLASWRFLYSSAMKRWTSLWNGTYCQKVSVVGALALTFGAWNWAGFWSSPTGVGTAVG